MKLAIAKAWRFAETQECVSTGGRVFVFCAASLANRARRFRDSRQGRRGGETLTPASPAAEKVRRDAARHVSRHWECAGYIREFDEKL